MTPAQLVPQLRIVRSRNRYRSRNRSRYRIRLRLRFRYRPRQVVFRNLGGGAGLTYDSNNNVTAYSRRCQTLGVSPANPGVYLNELKDAIGNPAGLLRETASDLCLRRTSQQCPTRRREPRSGVHDHGRQDRIPCQVKPCRRQSVGSRWSFGCPKESTVSRGLGCPPAIAPLRIRFWLRPKVLARCDPFPVAALLNRPVDF